MPLTKLFLPRALDDDEPDYKDFALSGKTVDRIAKACPNLT
jgi:hypothetical protein